MRFLGYELTLRRSREEKQTDTNLVTPLVPGYSITTPFGTVMEAFGGMWQRNLVINDKQTLLAFSAVFACIALISGDIAKLRIKLLRQQRNGFWEEDTSSAFSPVLRKPNGYQTTVQFVMNWMSSKLVWGNTYVLKERDARQIVTRMHVLDPQRVRPLVAPDGEVFYQIGGDLLAGVDDETGSIFPSSEVMHDRGLCLFHPLLGVSPLYASAISASEGTRIQTNSAKFFENMSRPSGQLTAPGHIDETTAARIKEHFESSFGGNNIGRVLVSGDGLKYEGFTIPAQQAQLIEQLKWTGEDVARAFLVPPYKIGLGNPPALGHVAALNQEYYQQVLQVNTEAIEALLDDGLSLPKDIAAEFDLDALLKMDPKTRAETNEINARSGILAPNEGRATMGLAPVPGGASPYLQQQNFSLAALAKRDANADPFGTNKPEAAPPAPADDAEDDSVEELAAALIAKFMGSEHAQP